MNKVIVIGGGPAGMMAAIASAEAGKSVVLLEKNEKLGKKLFITGKGRCNITNGCDTEELFANVMTNAKFLYSAFYGYDNQAVIRFFEETGCKVKEERGNRIFPVSDHSSDVIGALKRRLERSGVEVRLNTAVKDLIIQELPEGQKEVTGVLLTDGKKMEAAYVIVATGGVSYPLTGSTGDGYRFAEKAGHKVTDVLPALVPFVVKEEWCKNLQGLSLKNVTAVMKSQNKIIYEGFGEMLFTHFGVSGPLILTASSFYVKKYYGQPVTLSIDLKPALTAEQLDRRLLRDFEENKNKQFKNILGGLLPTKMHEVFVSLTAINEDKKVNEITKEERKRMIDLLKEFKMTVTGVSDFKEAIITQGGVSVKEINPSTMESKKVKGLLFAGEVLDLDALTGGFNLQIAWSTGYLAGSSIEREERREE